MTNLIQVPVPGQGGGRGTEKLAGVLGAQRTAERWATRRVRSARAVIWVSAAMAYLIAVETGCGTSGARLILGAWVVAFASLVVCAMAEVRAQRRVDELLAAAGGRRIHVAK